MKNTNIISLLVAASLSFSVSAENGDTESYIAVPVAKQRADLHDKDNDGVINARDKCDGTPLGAKVDNVGCELYVNTRQNQQLKVLFENNSSEVSVLFRKQIQTMASFMAAYPETAIELQGFASRTGNSKKNLQLSKQRAKQVENALVKYGVDRSRIRTIGFGDNKLSRTGDDPRSHALNRRVEATVVGLKGEVDKDWTIFTTLKK
ncbi:OmpA family protein [Vibrio sp. SCSIO 43136]|uniref:OmpA family protein n=1 Tax=Vibrio sp. SCSIO 43136 TaxID=2819101 RepID=UPI0020766330|nr:OmpA family protein [Vibrio sp. SCSIO 43136]USD66499.1 OmpA family protein [Vibrio sp. SCSIO 43136]